MLFGRQYFARLPLVALLVAWPAAGQALPQDSADRHSDSVAGSMASSGASASERILENIEEPALRELVGEVLERNPGVAGRMRRREPEQRCSGHLKSRRSRILSPA